MTAFRLKRHTIAAFSLPAIPVSAVGLPLTVYIPPLYAQETLLTVGLVGTLAFVARFFDVITDPLFGHFSDRTMTPFGRRRPWMVISTPLLMISIYMLFNPPTDAGALYLLTWLFGIYLGYTLYNLSHMAWGAELSTSYDERSRIQGWREFSLISGMLTVMLVPLTLPLFGIEGTLRNAASLMSNYIIFLLPVTVAIAVIQVPEIKGVERIASEKTDYRALFRSLVQNPYLARLLAGDLMQALGPAITGTVYLWLAVYYLDLEGYENFILFAYFVAATVGMPIWIQLSYRIGKHNTFAIAMLYSAVILTTFLVFPPGNLWIALIGTLAYGIGFGAGSFLLRSMMADVADHEKLNSGEERTGVYYSLLTLTGKFGAAMGPLIAYNFLELVGFDPKSETAGDYADWVLVVFVIPPAITLLLGALAMWRYPLTRERQLAMQEQIEARAAAYTDAPSTASTSPTIEKSPDAKEIRPAE